MKRPVRPWTSSAEQGAPWPPVSVNTINGMGEARVRRPSPVYRHASDATPHGPLQRWFPSRVTPRVQAAVGPGGN